ncbi:MAG: 6,7-dimethyl-8-ribityllumazine synthase [Rhizomicrobium sp.]
MNILIVESRYHPAIADALTDGATKALQLGGAHFTRAPVPGVMEIPAAIALGARADRFDGYVALGSMVRTGTAHFELITDNVFYGLTRLSTDYALCIGNGIVVATTEDAALQMALKEERDVGGDAARACLAMVALAKRLGEQS